MKCGMWLWNHDSEFTKWQFFEKPNYITSYRLSIDTIALNCLFFEKMAFFWHFGDRQTDKQTDRRTDGQHLCTKPLSLSRAAA